MKRPSAVDRFLSAKRLRKRLHRINVLVRRAHSTRSASSSRFFRLHPDSLIGWLADRLKEKDDQKSAQLTISIPKDFSVINNPGEVVATLSKIVSFARRPEVRSIFFDHSSMITFDLAAEQAIDTVASE